MVEDDYINYNGLITKNALVAQRKLYWAISKEEAIQIGWEVFLSKKKKFLLESESNIEGAIGLRIKGAIYDDVRRKTSVRVTKNGVQKSEKIVFEPLEGDWEFKTKNLTDSECVLKDMLIEYAPEEITFNEILSEIKNPRHKNILRLRYFYELSTKEIARRENTTSSRISQILAEALVKLRNNISLREYA